eukprot:gb/GECH01010049.1/.p1 GENE.gb/GECH01010049.1/~~gb/GECH01010049.1/.p1  ORF type:complete len:140 (+),score=20.74 gb/GECH01010049.1/:1-420(+)
MSCVKIDSSNLISNSKYVFQLQYFKADVRNSSIQTTVYTSKNNAQPIPVSIISDKVASSTSVIHIDKNIGFKTLIEESNIDRSLLKYKWTVLQGDLQFDSPSSFRTFENSFSAVIDSHSLKYEETYRLRVNVTLERVML